MRHFSKSIFFLVIFTFNFTFVAAKTADDRGIKKAIKKSDTEFFKTITLEDLEAGNKPNEEGRTLISLMEIDGVNALVGAFKNPNVEVRKRIYKELLYPDIFKDIEGVSVADFMSQDPQLKQYLDTLRIAIYSVDEYNDSEATDALAALILQYGYSVKEAIKIKNPKALAKMNPDFFKKSNLEDPKTVIVRFKKNGVKTLVKALEFEPGNPETRKLIIENLYYRTLGGPAKVLTKKRIRDIRAENLFVTADKEQNPEMRKLLVDLAETYYYAEEKLESENAEKSNETVNEHIKNNEKNSLQDAIENEVTNELKKTKIKKKKKKSKVE